MEDAPAKTRQGMNRLFEDAQTSPLKLAGVQAGGQSWGMCLIGWEWSRDQDSCLSLVESWGMFCVVRGSKVTDWVMCGIFAYWPSWSVSVNKELKPLISQTISLSVVSGDMDGAQEDIAFHILNTRLQSPSPGIVLHSHHSDYWWYSQNSWFVKTEVAKSFRRDDIRRQFRYLDWRGVISVRIIFWKISLLQYYIPCQLILKGRSLLSNYCPTSSV